MGQFGRPFKKCQTVKKLTSGGFSSVTTSAITSAAPLSKRGSSWTREVARFCCILGKYLSEEVVWVQIDPESLTRPSAPALVGGRCKGLSSSSGGAEVDQCLEESWRRGDISKDMGSVAHDVVDDGKRVQLIAQISGFKRCHVGVMRACPAQQ